MKKLIDSQKKFFQSKFTLDVNFRIQQLRKLERILNKHEADLDRAIYSDFGKSSFENYATELGLIYHEIDIACRNLKRWSKVKRVYTNIANLPGKSYVVPEPLGVSLVIGAWNYPYQLSLGPAVAAIAAGNTVVLKPSELSVETSKIMSRLINDNFKSDFFTVVEGGVEETTELLAQKFDKIFFTGSTAVGRIVYQAAAKNLTPVTLELGGKSPAIIDEKCNLKTTAKRLVWAKFINAGQTCIAPDYVLVQKSIKEKFLKQVALEIEKSNYAVENHNYVQIINEKNMERLLNFIDKDKVYVGGDFDLETRHISPTVLVDVSFEDKVMQEEIFGPIMPVLDYDTMEDAIAMIKEKPKPLACYVFTNSKKKKWNVLNEVSFGGGAVNDAVMHISNSRLPFGGVGESGIGAYHGEFGFKAFSHFKSVLEKPTWIEPNLKYFPLTDLKFRLIKFVLKL